MAVEDACAIKPGRGERNRREGRRNLKLLIGRAYQIFAVTFALARK